MQDLFNEWHAKNTSDKVRRVMQSRGNAGIPLTTSAPYGYKKAPEDKNHWIVDEPAAEVVRQIFRLSISGLGPTQIAKKLRSEGVMTPSEYFQSVGVNCPTKPPAYPCNWSSGTVAGILDRQEYQDGKAGKPYEPVGENPAQNRLLKAAHKQGRVDAGLSRHTPQTAPVCFVDLEAVAL